MVSEVLGEMVVVKRSQPQKDFVFYIFSYLLSKSWAAFLGA